MRRNNQGGLDIAWGASSRGDTITRRLAEKMRKAGCWILFLGIESASQKIPDWIGKKITIEQIRKAVKTIERAGIQVLGSFIIGFAFQLTPLVLDFATLYNCNF